MSKRQHSFAGLALRRLAQALLLLPFVVMSLFAPGVMPSRAADGTMQVVLCSPEGPVNLTIGPDGEPVPTSDMPQDERCSWASHRVDLADLVLPLLPLPERVALENPLVLLWAEHRPAHDPRGLYARGPPAIL